MSAHDLFLIVSNAASVLSGAVFAAINVYIDASIVFFIIDAIKAKKEGRKIKTGFKVMFIIAMVLLAVTLALGIYAICVLFNIFMFGPF